MRTAITSLPLAKFYSENFQNPNRIHSRVPHYPLSLSNYYSFIVWTCILTSPLPLHFPLSRNQTPLLIHWIYFHRFSHLIQALFPLSSFLLLSISRVNPRGLPLWSRSNFDKWSNFAWSSHVHSVLRTVSTFIRPRPWPWDTSTQLYLHPQIFPLFYQYHGNIWQS